MFAADAKFNNAEELIDKHLKEPLDLEIKDAFIPNRARFNKIITEYESRESEFAKAVDCLDACIRNINNDLKSSEVGFTQSLISEKYFLHVSKFKITEELFETFMSKLIQQQKF